MKKLHLVGFTADSDGLILSVRKGAKSGGFILPLDDTLVSAIELARRRRDGELETGEGDAAARGGPAAPDRPRSALSPREIQARLRAGSSVSEVAAQAGADDEWVLRFAAPILAEQAKVIDSAQRLTMAKSRRGPSIEALAPSVQWNLSYRGVRMSGDVFADCWSAYNLHGARWAVRFSYTSRKRHQVAEWEVDLRERTLVARNRLASDLGHVEQGRRRPTAEELEAPSEPAAAAAAAPAPTPAPAPRPPAPRRPPAARAMSAPPADPAPATSPRKKAKAAPAKTGGRTTKSTPAKATARATKAPAPAKTAAPAAKTAAASKAAGRGAKGAAPAKTSARSTKASTPARAAAQPAAKRSPRQPTARKAAPAKKKPADAPGGATRSSRGRAAEPPPESEDRPSHLGRPPSPMKFSNRATSLPIRRGPTSYERPRPAPAPAPRRNETPPLPAPAPEPPAVTGPEPANPANPRFEPRPEPDFADPSGRAAAPGAAGRIRSGTEVGRRPKASRPQVETPKPAVVILSTPGVEHHAEPASMVSVEDQERQARLASAERLRAALAAPPEPPEAPAPEAPADAAPARPRRATRRQSLAT